MLVLLGWVLYMSNIIISGGLLQYDWADNMCAAAAAPTMSVHWHIVVVACILLRHALYMARLLFLGIEVVTMCWADSMCGCCSGSNYVCVLAHCGHGCWSGLASHKAWGVLA